MSDVFYKSIAEVAEDVRARRLSPVELTEACLARIGQVDSQLNAFITLTSESAREDARAAEAEIAAGNYRGTLHGIPLALKDIFDVAGVRTTAASKILADNVAAEDSGVTKHLRKAGAVLLGKLNLHQFAYGATGRSSEFGPARNPWDTERVTGGSSSGSGAAVASGECFAAMGTDTGGSIRIPASLCGVVGLKPTFGRVSRAGLLPLSWSLDHAGPLTRTVQDAAMVLQAVAGRDESDDWSSDEAVPNYTATLGDGVKGLRIGVPDSFFNESLLPEIDAAVKEALSVLEGLGATIEPVTMPFIADIPNALTAIMLPEALAYHQKWMAERPEDYADDVRYRLELGSTFPAVDYVQAQRFREMAVRAWRDEVFSRFDLIATAATQTTATPIEASDLSVVFSLIRLTNPLNLLGVPAISVPCGFSPQGLPIGLQLVGRWWDEAAVLRAAHAYEQATDWHARRPPLAQT
jgi:aspartyl-tRNA(Asn)/glutamyl-tRNA(Gln) amidotransferase subunit A